VAGTVIIFAVALTVTARGRMRPPRSAADVGPAAPRTTAVSAAEAAPTR